MKIYLDDMRKAPLGWDRVLTADACIEKLATGKVKELSLDHDLTYEHYDDVPSYPGVTDEMLQEYERSLRGYKEKTGYGVVQWMIENGVWPSLIILHTMNPVGREAMERAIRKHAPGHVTIEIRIGWRG